MKRNFCIWAQVDETVPWKIWWQEICETFTWPAQLDIEKWEASASLPQILDSVNSFSLFGKTKVIVVMNADKSLKKDLDAKSKELKEVFKKLNRGPHYVILHSEKEAPKAWPSTPWTSQKNEEEQIDDKAAFRWVDAIHQENLSKAIKELELALASSQHPLMLLQLLTRHYRMGRLIQYAQEAHLSEQEMTRYLKAPAFVIRKWTRKRAPSNAHWSRVFDRLWDSDFELKSGYDGAWALRKLTLDLIQLNQPKRSPRHVRAVPAMRPFSNAPLLWPNAPSFA